MDREWVKERRFSSLSIRDLLDAREAYHVHLAHLDNVFATAIGRYLILDEDPDAKKPEKVRKGAPAAPRTLANSSVKPWSWPCILVFVNQWRERTEFGDRPDAMVPRFLYLPDGRVVPTCVVFAEERARDAALSPEPVFPSDLLGGGFPAVQDIQNRLRLSSIGCLVTDGDQVFALTNRHVTGEAGRPVHTVVAGRRQKIGHSQGRDIGKKLFSEVYPGWPGSRVMLNLDAGLVRVDDVARWTAQVFGVGELGPIWDLHVDSFDLDVLECPARAYGAAGGALEGRIQALFFRYKTRGGIEYVSDFLIGPRAGATTVGTRPGDSGTIWFADDPRPTDGRALARRPFAMQWGGQSLYSPGADVVGDFALATCLSTVCRELDVEVITDWNVGQPETWGAVGHFKIGAFACELVEEDWLRGLFIANQGNIGYDDAALRAGLPDHPSSQFVPLADVADFVWRKTRKLDDNNHFADIDHKAPETAPAKYRGKSLLELTKGKPQKVHPDFWNGFYEAVGEDKRGALPFRVWQIYDEMVDFARASDLQRFVCAAGLMAHYVGDACQPLHVSEHHHGRNEEESRVHSSYETAMLARYADEMIAGLAALRANGAGVDFAVGGGHSAAVAIVELMRRTVERLPPLRVVEVYVESNHRTEEMWRRLGEDTISCLFDGASTLARLWQAAWREGRGAAANPAAAGTAINRDALKSLYEDKAFLPSWRLRDVKEVAGRLVSST